MVIRGLIKLHSSDPLVLSGDRRVKHMEEISSNPSKLCQSLMCFICSCFHWGPQYSAYKLPLKTEGEVLQARSSGFLLSAPLKMVHQKTTRANPLQHFPVYSFILYFVYSVNIALKGSGMRGARCHLLHNISSEDIKSNFCCYPQSVRTNPTKCDIVMRIC